MTLLYVLNAARLELLFGVDYVRDAVCTGFIANEAYRVYEEMIKGNIISYDILKVDLPYDGDRLGMM